MSVLFQSPVSITWPYVIQAGVSAPLTVATFADLAALSPSDGEYVVVTDATPYAESVVVWSNKNSRWELYVSLYAGATPSGDEIYNSGGVLVKAITITGLIDSVNSSGYYWNGATWVVLKDITPVATFGNLPVGVLYQQAIVLDNGFLSPSFVAFDGVNWVVTVTRVSAFGDLPVDGVWNLSPSVVSDTDTVVSDNSPPAIYWNWDGASWVEYTEPPKYTVATFSALPSNAAVGQRVTVTGESGLSKLTVINTAANTWAVGTVSTDYPTYSAIEWGTVPGEWYNAGGIVVTTSNGCLVMDAINKISFYWDAVNTMFVPLEVFEGTIASVAKIKGDDATPDFWFMGNSAGTGTAINGTLGGKLVLDTTNAGGTPALASATFQDLGLMPGTNAYAKAMVQVAGSGGSAYATLFAIEDSSKSYGFAHSNTVTGRWVDTATGIVLADQAAGDQDFVTSEVFLEVQKIVDFVQFRINGGRWSSLSGASAVATLSTNFKLVVYCVGAGSAASLTVRHLVYARY